MGNGGSGLVVLGPTRRHRKFRRFPVTRHLIWSGLLRVIQRLTHYKRGDRLEFKISFSVRDLLSDKGRAVKGQVGALVHAVDALKDRVPPDVLTNLTESTPVREAARLSRATAQRLRRGEGDKGGCENGFHENAAEEIGDTWSSSAGTGSTDQLRVGDKTGDQVSSL